MQANKVAVQLYSKNSFTMKHWLGMQCKPALILLSCKQKERYIVTFPPPHFAPYIFGDAVS